MGQPFEELLKEAAESGSNLYVRIGNGSPLGELWIRGGAIVASSSPHSDARLGARLLSTGQLREFDLKEAQRNAPDGLPLAHALAGRVRRELLTSIATEEARFVLTLALTATEEELSSREEDPPPGLPSISLEVSSALEEAALFVDSLRDAEKIAPHGSRPLATRMPGMAEGLTAEEWAVVDRCNGSSTVAEIASMCGLTAPAASLIVSKLCTFGVVDIEQAIVLPEELDWRSTADLEAISQQSEVGFEELSPELLLGSERFDEIMPEPPVEVGATINTEEETLETPLPAPQRRPLVDTASLLRELSSIARDQGKS